MKTWSFVQSAILNLYNSILVIVSLYISININSCIALLLDCYYQLLSGCIVLFIGTWPAASHCGPYTPHVIPHG